MAEALRIENHSLSGSDAVHICFICISLRGGGTERVVTSLANQLCKSNSVSIVILNDSEPFYWLDPKVRLIRYPEPRAASSRWRRVVGFMQHLRRSVRQLEPDIILSFGELISPVARISTLGIKSRFYISNRESPLRSLSGRAGWVNPMIYPFADGVIAQTQAAVQILRRRYHWSRFTIIPNPVDIPDQVLPIRERENWIVSVGFLGGQKNQATLLHSFSRARLQNEWRLVLAGDGPDRPKLESLAVSLGIDERVDFLGETRDVPELLQRSRIFAFASLSEGFPNALAEALAHGCACIAFDCVTGPSELIDSGDNGLLVPPDDDKAYSASLDQLMADENLQERLAKRARVQIRHFSQDAVFDQYVQLVHAGISKGLRCES